MTNVMKILIDWNPVTGSDYSLRTPKNSVDFVLHGLAWSVIVLSQKIYRVIFLTGPTLKISSFFSVSKMLRNFELVLP